MSKLSEAIGVKEREIFTFTGSNLRYKVIWMYLYVDVTQEKGRGEGEVWEVVKDSLFLYALIAHSEMIERSPSNIPEHTDKIKCGKWVLEPEHLPRCSVCGKYSLDADEGAFYCPWCGSKNE